jgi:hypothetical protein
MPSNIQDDLTLARLLGYLYTEVFETTSADPNIPLNRSAHLDEEQFIRDRVRTTVLAASANYVWGPGGVSPMSGLPGMHATWGIDASYPNFAFWA